MRKILLLLSISILFTTKIYAEHIFTEREKAQISKNVAIAISSVGKQLAIDETIMKVVNKQIISKVLMHVLSRFSDETLSKFLSINQEVLFKKIGTAFANYEASNTLNIIKKYHPKQGFFKVNATDMIFIVLDITVEFVKLEIIKDEAKQLLLDLIYNDLKAYVKLNSGDPIGATIDWGKANVTALYKSGKGIYKETKELRKLTSDRMHMSGYNRVIEIQNNYLSFVAKAETKEEKKARLRGFLDDCINDDILKYYLNGFNNKKLMFDYCTFYQKSIEKFDKNKHFYLIKRMTGEAGLYSKNDFDKYLKKYFSYKDIELYKNIYYSVKYNKSNYINILNPQDVSHKYIKRLVAYGFRVEDFIFDDTNTFQFNKLMRKSDIIELISLGLNSNKFSEENMNNLLKKEGNGKASREQLAKYIIEILKIDNLLTEKQRSILRKKANILQKVSYEALVLKKLNIIDEFGKEYKWKSLVTKYEFIKILTYSLDNLTCGHIECSLDETIKGLRNESK